MYRLWEIIFSDRLLLIFSNSSGVWGDLGGSSWGEGEGTVIYWFETIM